jgi:hypothetical protein
MGAAAHGNPLAVVGNEVDASNGTCSQSGQTGRKSSAALTAAHGADHQLNTAVVADLELGTLLGKPLHFDVVESDAATLPRAAASRRARSSPSRRPQRVLHRLR